MANNDWDATETLVASTGRIEQNIVWDFDEDGDPTLNMTVNVVLLDTDGNELDHKYMRDTTKVEAALTAPLLSGINALGARWRSKADTKFVPVPE